MLLSKVRLILDIWRHLYTRRFYDCCKFKAKLLEFHTTFYVHFWDTYGFDPLVAVFIFQLQK